MTIRFNSYYSTQCLACGQNYGTAGPDLETLATCLERDGWYVDPKKTKAVCKKCVKELLALQAAGITTLDLVPANGKVKA